MSHRNHFTEAETLLRQLTEAQETLDAAAQDGVLPPEAVIDAIRESANHIIAQAQVHALLASVEQAKIANLIALSVQSDSMEGRAQADRALYSRVPDATIPGHIMLPLRPEEEITLVAITWITPHEVRKVIATGEEVPIVEIRRIEPIGTPDQVSQVIIDLATRLHEQRTGRAALPIEALESPKGDVDELDDGEPIPSDVEGGDPARGERKRMMRPEPRIARDPAQIGEIFSFGGEG